MPNLWVQGVGRQYVYIQYLPAYTIPPRKVSTPFFSDAKNKIERRT
jgi:hypothetical protein